MTQSVSFRITRTAEDVAHTINALSQRLVKLEQRLESLELQVSQQRQTPEMPAEELARLDDVDRLLMECQSMLQSSELQSPEADLSQGATDEPFGFDSASVDGDPGDQQAA